MITPQLLSALKNKGQDEVRRVVRATLQGTPSYAQLAVPERISIAKSLVEVLTCLTTDPDRRVAAQHAPQPKPGGAAARGGAAGMAARGLDAPAPVDPAGRDALNKRLSEKPEQVGQNFKAGGVREAADAYKALADAVDFPKFVASLIEGVFTSIVNSSIKQMHEFGKFLNGVAMTLKEFADENVNSDEARDYLTGKYPKALTTEDQKGRKRLVRRDDVDDDAMPDFKSLFNLNDDVDLSDDDSEAKVVEGAQMQLARMRQQQLATMVLLGINRIVVTEGEIKATVQFDVSGKDTAGRQADASMADTQTHFDAKHSYDYQRNRSFWGTSGSGSGSSSSDINTRVSTAGSNVHDDSESKAEAKAKMTGYVQVKFKSETFPLDRMASQVEVQQMQEKAAR
jgi:hypothetical protein